MAAHAQPLPASRWTPEQIREAFQRADANGDGVLTRAEAQHLPIMPRSFEDTDLNKDGVLTLEEYLASFAS
jgi:Ca2+-binding EF-hand superfamily protein